MKPFSNLNKPPFPAVLCSLICAFTCFGTGKTRPADTALQFRFHLEHAHR
jgi:hypothetical protein